MKTLASRRRFLGATASAATLAGLGDFDFLGALPPVSAEDAKLEKRLVQFKPEIEPLVRLLEDTPRERLLEEAAARVQRGVAHRELVAALLLAGIRNIQPRPVGFKFHAVLVIHSAHLASQSSPDSDRWLPIFWALDQFKDSQAQNLKQGGWRMGPVDEAAVPPPHKAREAFVEAMDKWDESAVDAAVTGLARAAGANEVFDLFCRYGARDFRDIGHKAIYVGNSWRTLQAIGWQHAEPVLRSLAYALLEHEGENPARRDAAPDRPWRRNIELARQFRPDWQAGERRPEAVSTLVGALRQASDAEAPQKVLELLNQGVSPGSIWDGYFACAGELLMRNPGIGTLHAVTSTNALHFEFKTCGHEETRRMLMLQAASFLTLFRGNVKSGVEIDTFDPGEGTPALDEVFAEIKGNRPTAARKALAYLKASRDPKAFMDTARRLIFVKGTNAHDYKFSSAVMENYFDISPALRDRYLAASVFQLRGSTDADNQLVRRIRSALSA
jgi:hypothetical protein